eukprot:TRINITY_DN55549_c0_g1_i1.p1 TRINITY_DN55549_c0_g1~~TRINITY_DN55549_c0_g1_i1.p1  ORF type:complete len:241 (+),score=85.95 TRINITY_DN55549_c0_g1_i1:103-825(+)
MLRSLVGSEMCIRDSYWESTASGDHEDKAIQILSSMITHLKNDTFLEDKKDMTLGERAEAKAKMMAERRQRLRDRRAKRALLEHEARGEFAMQMFKEGANAHLSTAQMEQKRQILGGNAATAESVFDRLKFRSCSPRLTNLIDTTFTQLDEDEDGALSFREVLHALGEDGTSGYYHQALEKFAAENEIESEDLLLNFKWTQAQWTLYWQSTQLTEHRAIAQLSSVQRRLEAAIKEATSPE